jgi:hypothetical protein
VNKETCSAHSTTCGKCLSGFKKDGKIDNSDLNNTNPLILKAIADEIMEQNPTIKVKKTGTFANQKAQIQKARKKLQQQDNGTSCVDACDADLRNECANSNKASCSYGKATCGNCDSGFKSGAGGNSCIDVCETDTLCSQKVCLYQNKSERIRFKTRSRNREAECSKKNMTHCVSGTATCGGCLHGFKLDDKGDACVVDVCDNDAKEACLNANKLKCFPGTTTCGRAREYHSVVSHNVVLQGILASKFNSDKNIKLSFRKTISKTLGVPLSDIVNINAEPSTTRRRRFLSTPGKTTERKLSEVSCT